MGGLVEDEDEEEVADAVVASPAPVAVDSHRAFACDVDMVWTYKSWPSIYPPAWVGSVALYLPPSWSPFPRPPPTQAITYLDECQRPAFLLQEGPHVCFVTC